MLQHRPDVVLMDIRLPEMDGLETARRILGTHPDADCRIICLTTFDLDQCVYAALAGGASGFLLKDATAAELVHAVRVVAAGDALLAPSVTRRLVERFAPARLWPPRGAPGSVRAHPPRAGGAAAAGPRLSNAELAAQLTLSEATVKTHVSRILARLQLRDWVQAVVLAYETGLADAGR